MQNLTVTLFQHMFIAAMHKLLKKMRFTSNSHITKTVIFMHSFTQKSRKYSHVQKKIMKLLIVFFRITFSFRD